MVTTEMRTNEWKFEKEKSLYVTQFKILFKQINQSVITQINILKEIKLNLQMKDSSRDYKEKKKKGISF